MQQGQEVEKMAEIYIKLDAAEERLNRLERESHHNSVLWPDHVDECREALREIEPADVVSRDCYNRILADNDTMLEMLAQIGKEPVDKMDDARTVKRGEWDNATDFIYTGLSQRVMCGKCGAFAYFYDNMPKKFCPNCGEGMKGGE